MPAEPAAVAVAPGWHARLELEFAPAFGRTIVAHRRHVGPLCIQKPFHPGDGSCHVYVLHPPGGLTGGDDVALTATVARGGSALITMPASTKFYRTDGRSSYLRTELSVAAAATLEWLPTETLLFGGSRAVLETVIRLASGSRFIGWEAMALGRPLSGDHYASGEFSQKIALYVDERPVLLERMAGTAGDPWLAADWGLGGQVLSATWLAFPGSRKLLATVREALAGHTGVCHGASLVDDVLVLRVLGQKLEPVRRALEAARAAVAPALLGRAAGAPRIWNT